MINYSYMPTDQNVLKLLEADLIGRNQDIGQFLRLLCNMEDDCYSIALNGDWGAGKTFFIKQLKLLLDAKNPCSVMDNTLRSEVLRIAGENFEIPDSYTTVYYDAWLNDNHVDPILSLIHTSVQSGQSDFSAQNSRSLGGIVTALVNMLTGYDAVTFGEKLQGSDPFELLKSGDDICSYVKDFIDCLILEHGNRLVFFIDELDRCKPDFAVRFLEMIKHYFNDDRVTFVFAVNLFQLQWTVKSYYGAEFDATRYLDKFFDLRIPLRSLDYEAYLLSRLKIDHSRVFNAVAIESAKYFRFSLREVERYGRMLKIADSAIRSAPKSISEDNAIAFSADHIVPIVLAVQMHDIVRYGAFIGGHAPELVQEILLRPNIEMDMNLLMVPGEKYMASGKLIQNSSNAFVSLSDRLQEVYRALFAQPLGNHADEETIAIGKMTFSNFTRQYIEEITSMLSPCSKY